MNKYVLGIDGMMCGHCEIHVKEAITKKIKVVKAVASHVKNNLVVISEKDLTIKDFHDLLDPTGYRITSFKKEEAVKSLFGWK